ncbi:MULTISPECIES: alpha/beta hydrolase [unclassified Brevibacterium]|uniref:alpha/beta fold hydrolase n=1 Tax=unclassified Brevibacterium TaxID=2614124 RepID=UPI0010F6AD0D|nr:MULTISPECIES: alpha/beta hydrolase [unclassified Brevibacterium]MCM1011725.1 alpha/beta fold hydrolase [Brevibacterium sp. XM4083]
MPHFTTERVRTGDFTTSYLDSGGTGDVVVLLHGGGPGANSVTNWAEFIPGLSDDYRVIAPDIYGWGATDHPGEDALPGSMTAWVRARVNQILDLLDALDIDRAHFVGNSAGGALSLWITHTAPERVIDLVLMGSAGGQMAAPTPEVIRMVSFYKDPSEAGLKSLTRWFVYDEDSLGDSLDTIVENRLAEVLRPEVRRSFQSMYATPTSPAEMTVPPSALRRITHRVLLVHGREDRFITPDSSVYFSQHLPNSQVHIFDRCGHWVQIERRDPMLFLVRGFLTGEL